MSTTIYALSGTNVLRDTDAVPVFSVEQGGTVKATLPQLAAYVQSEIEGVPDQTVYAITITNTGFIASVMPSAPGASMWAQITLSNATATGVINLPPADSRAPGQEVLVTCTQAVSALTVNGNGPAVLGAPASLSANGFFRLRYDSISNKWYRVG